jgi:hypothetical protein
MGKNNQLILTSVKVLPDVFESFKLSSIKNCMNASYPYSFTPLSKSPVIGLSNNFYFSDNKLNLERLNPRVTKSSDTSKTSEK